jgi:signal peptidase I
MPVRSDMCPPVAVGRRVAWAAVVLLVAAVLGVAGWLAGNDLTPVAIYGDSMLPTIAPGDVLLVRRGVAAAPGDVVTYDAETRLITHRLRALATDGSMVLRGDANGFDDPPVPTDRALGVAERVVPHVGLPVVWARDGRVRAAGAAGLVLVLPLSRWRARRRSQTSRSLPGGPS